MSLSLSVIHLSLCLMLLGIALRTLLSLGKLVWSQPSWFGFGQSFKVVQVTDSSRSAGVHGHRVHDAVGDELERGRVVAAQSARALSMSHGIPGYAWLCSADRGLAPVVACGLTSLGWPAAVPSASSGPGCSCHGSTDVAAAPPLFLSTVMMTRSPWR